MFLDNYKKLITAIAEKERDAEEVQDMYEFLDERVMRMPEYIQSVSSHVLGSESAIGMMKAGRLSVENYQDRIMSLDSERRSKHDVMLGSMNQLNRMCDNYGVAHICPDNEDRHLRANFAAAVTMECFMTDHGQSRDEIEQMYKLVKADPKELNVDKTISLSRMGAKINARKRLSEGIDDR